MCPTAYQLITSSPLFHFTSLQDFTRRSFLWMAMSHQRMSESSKMQNSAPVQMPAHSMTISTLFQSYFTNLHCCLQDSPFCRCSVPVCSALPLILDSLWFGDQDHCSTNIQLHLQGDNRVMKQLENIFPSDNVHVVKETWHQNSWISSLFGETVRIGDIITQLEVPNNVKS